MKIKMSGLKERQRPGGPPEEGKDEIWFKFRDTDGTVKDLRIRRGTRVKDFLGGLKFKYRRGITITLNERTLEADKETGELLDDESNNPVITESVLLAIDELFVGG